MEDRGGAGSQSGAAEEQIRGLRNVGHALFERPFRYLDEVQITL